MASSLNKNLKTSQPSTCIQVQIKRERITKNAIGSKGKGQGKKRSKSKEDKPASKKRKTEKQTFIPPLKPCN